MKVIPSVGWVIICLESSFYKHFWVVVSQHALRIINYLQAPSCFAGQSDSSAMTRLYRNVFSEKSTKTTLRSLTQLLTEVIHESPTYLLVSKTIRRYRNVLWCRELVLVCYGVQTHGSTKWRGLKIVTNHAQVITQKILDSDQTARGSV